MRDTHTMDALVVLVIYLGPFILIGLAAMWWARRKNTDLSDIQAQAGENRRKRRVFLLGFWRSEE